MRLDLESHVEVLDHVVDAKWYTSKGPREVHERMKSVGAVTAIVLDYLREKLWNDGIQYQPEFTLEKEVRALTCIDQQTAPAVRRMFATTGLSMIEVCWWPRLGMVLGLKTVKMNNSRYPISVRDL